jgi:hypothetical protein
MTKQQLNTTYQEMVDLLAGLSESERQKTIQQYWEAVFSNGFIGFVQGQIEAGRKMTHPDSKFKNLFSGSLGDAIIAQSQQNLENLLSVWKSMAICYEVLRKRSEKQGNSKGMVAHGNHTAMPRGVSIPEAAKCYRCGNKAVGNGLCSGCLATQQDWEQDDLDYDRQLYERHQNDLDYQRVQDDQIYYNNQYDYNTYSDY